ncbi:MAG: protein of unknown function (DUF4838) [Verrucomicrobia bacterium]|nr:MAG: protein of unknown function (DUF4838) [Verrucomicrobiota bacterium]
MFNFYPPIRWFGVLALAVSLAGLAAAAIPVFRSGKPLLPIYVAADAVPAERAAAEELARVLQVMSGLAWRVQVEKTPGGNGFYVGRTHAVAPHGPGLKPTPDLVAPQAGEIGPDGIRIRSLGGSVFLEGATPEATGFAVAWLLQREGGVRWYAPGPTGEIIPRRPEWVLPDLDLVREPAYVSREIYGTKTRDGSEWARHNGLRSRLEFSHALTRVFPPEIMAAHPEWCSLVRGARLGPASPGDNTWQPNLALPETAAFAAQAAAAALAQEPARASFSLAMNDSVRFDQGSATRALVEPLRYFRGRPDYSPLVFTFTNRAAEAVTRTNPGHYLGCLAYFWCENPPPFRVNPQVVPFITTDRTQYYDPGYRADDLALMSRWGESGVRAFGLWEYAEGAGFLVPRVPVTVLAAAVQEGWRRGARGYFAEMEAQPGFDTFKAWMLAQLLWDPARTMIALADDFYPGYYGPAADPMRWFFECCEAQWMAQAGAPSWLKFYQQEDQALLFPPDVCRALRARLDQAARRALGDASATARVEQTSRAFAVTEAFVEFDTIRRKLFALAGDETAPGVETETAITGAIRQLGQARARLRETWDRAPGMAATDPLFFTRNDPVPRLLWLAGRADVLAPRRILDAAGVDAQPGSSWRIMAEVFGPGSVPTAANLAANSSFGKSAAGSQEPRFLYPHSGAVPADWELRAMPTETGKVALTDRAAPGSGRALRVEGAWDTQLYQWLPAAPGGVYLATAQLRGQSSPGGDSALFLKFRTAAGQPTGVFGMQALPKGTTAAWRTAALADRAPADAAWVGIGVVATRQAPGDWLEIRAVELRDGKGEENL